jgi:small subunit ribosomal protein S3
VTVTISTSKPGVIIGRGAANIDLLRANLQKKFPEKIDVKVVEIRKPELNARLVGENIAQQIERRISYRRACKGAIQRARELGALGIKIITSGRLNGAEIARDETFTEGNIPLQTIRLDIDF